MKSWSDARPGQSLVIIAMLGTVLLGIMALSVDVGLMWWNKRGLQNLADVAALAGAQEYDDSNPDRPQLAWPMAQNIAIELLRANGFTCIPTNCDVTRPDPVGDPATIEVKLTRTVKLGFAGVIGFSSAPVGATARARAVRYRPTGQAVIAGAGGVTVQGGPATAKYRITGDVVSDAQIGGSSSTGIIMMRPGEAYARGQITAAVDPAPGHAGFDTSPFVDPIPRELPSGLPAFPPEGNCTSAQPDQVDPLDPLRRSVFGGDVDVRDNERVTFNPGHYCSIRFAGNNSESIFKDGNYFVNIEFRSFQTGQEKRIRMDAPLENCGSSCSTGVYIAVIGDVSLVGNTRFQLRGRRAYRDILFHARGSAVVDLTNSAPSNALGTVYAPNSIVQIRGNACEATGPDPCGPSARVTRGQPPGGGTSITQYGGRVIGRTVILQVDPSVQGNSWGIDYPPITGDYVFAPTLVR